ncbi:MAG: 2-oxoacid:acceptor oxidoreductase family protein, partial [Deferribacterota bacterium]|nr:2-oxoacid:acceptor oxidoreductase family protein [Deferribacterota bacterium]
MISCILFNVTLEVLMMEDITILIGAQAGQGLNVVENILVQYIKKNNYYIYSSKEYMSRVRGGINTLTLIISNKRKKAIKRDVDIVFTISKGVLEWCEKEGRLNNNTLVVGEDKYLQDKISMEVNKLVIDLEKTVKELGDKRYLNVLIAGVLSSILNTKKELITDVLENVFKGKGNNVIEGNKQAFYKGIDIGKDI